MKIDELRKLSQERLGYAGHTAELGLRLVDCGDNWCEIALDYRPELAISRSHNLLASGPLISLIDNASGLSVVVLEGRFRAFATLDLRVDYLRAAPPGKAIFARATCYRLTRNVAFVSADAHDGDLGDPIARSQATFFCSGD